MQPRAQNKSEEERGVIHIKFVGGEDQPILFANHIFVRGTPDGLLVSFAQSHGPYVVRPSQEELEKEGVPAKVICRLLIPLSRIPEIARIFQDQAKRVTITTGEITNDPQATS